MLTLFILTSVSGIINIMCIDSQAQPTWQIKSVGSDKEKTAGIIHVPSFASKKVLLYDPFDNWTYWQTDVGWGITNVNYVSPSQSAVSISRYFIVNSTIALKDPIDLTGKCGTTLEFYMRLITTKNHWFGIEASRDGIRWDTIDRVSGDSNGWVKKEYSLKDYDNSPYLKIQFRLASDGSTSVSGCLH